MAPTTQTLRRGPTIKPLHMVGIGIVIVTIVYTFFGVQSGMRSYVTSVPEALQSGRSVQLAGFLGSKGEYDKAGHWTFMLQDENGAMVKVVSDKPRPANFDQAISIVAMGRYDASKDAFIAEDLLVKCPSKYQEMQESGAQSPHTP